MPKHDDAQEHRQDDLALGALETIAFHFPFVALVAVFAAVAIWAAFSFITKNWVAIAVVTAVAGLGLLAWRTVSRTRKDLLMRLADGNSEDVDSGQITSLYFGFPSATGKAYNIRTRVWRP